MGDRHSEAPTATRRGSNGGETDPAVRRLCTVPGVGSVTAVAYVATIDHPHRFPHARQVAGPYLTRALLHRRSLLDRL